MFGNIFSFVETPKWAWRECRKQSCSRKMDCNGLKLHCDKIWHLTHSLIFLSFFLSHMKWPKKLFDSLSLQFYNNCAELFKTRGLSSNIFLWLLFEWAIKFWSSFNRSISRSCFSFACVGCCGIIFSDKKYEDAEKKNWKKQTLRPKYPLGLGE